MEGQKQRFIKLKHRIQDKATTTSFTSATDKQRSQTHPVIAMIAQSDPQKAKELEVLLSQLLDNEPVFMDWLQASPENAILFAENPLEVVRKVIPSLARI